MGSTAYGVSDDTSDVDLYGFCIPPKDVIFPHLSGYITGFGPQPKPFGDWQQHHIFSKDAKGGKGQTYDITIYNIVKYFDLCMACNPNMIDSIFTPTRCVTSSTKIGNMVRDNKHLFLSKKAWHSFKGYAYSQIHKMKIKSPEVGSKRYESIQKYGFDVKFAYHVVRLILECEQILTEGDIDLERKDRREVLKAVRRGDWSEDKVVNFFSDKEKQLEQLYHESNAVPHKPDYDKIKALLLNCLEEHFGNLDSAIHVPGKAERKLAEIGEIING
jgi:predicted nucleotidyltransferase